MSSLNVLLRLKSSMTLCICSLLCYGMHKIVCYSKVAISRPTQTKQLPVTNNPLGFKPEANQYALITIKS